MNYWYVARDNELFIDTDNISKSIAHTKARLQGAIECERLDVSYIMFRLSKSKNHQHTIITLKKPISDTERYVWEVILHGDIYRACCNFMRLLNGVPSPDVLISPYLYFHDYVNDKGTRLSDDKCECKQKHNKEIMSSCPAATRLRGAYRNVGFFGKPSKNPCTIWPK